MALTLDLPVKFLNSDFVPEICVYTGKTQNVEERTQSFQHISAIGNILMVVCILFFWPLAIVIWLVMRKVVSATIPQIQGARTKWGWLRNLWLIPILVLGAGGCILGLIIDTRNPDFMFAGGGIGFVLGVIAAIALSIWVNNTTITIKPIDEDHLRIKWPDRLAATHQAYQDAFQAWKKEGGGKRTSRRRDREDDEDEGWADGDGADAGWDQSKKR